MTLRTSKLAKLVYCTLVLATSVTGQVSAQEKDALGPPSKDFQQFKQQQRQQKALEQIESYRENISQKDYTNSVIFQAINKITARVSSINARVATPAKFGNLEIVLHTCWKSPPEEAPESKALLQIFEEVPGEPKKQVFYGWMFASTPSLSALEHPVYDITVSECRHNATL